MTREQNFKKGDRVRHREYPTWRGIVVSTCEILNDAPGPWIQIRWDHAPDDGWASYHVSYILPEPAPKVYSTGKRRKPTDFTLLNCGSVALLTPVTRKASEWVLDHLPADCPCLGNAKAIEPRYLGPILDGIADDGLTVNQ